MHLININIEESDNGNNNQAPGDLGTRPHGSRGPCSGHGCAAFQGPMGPVALVFINLHAKQQTFSAKDDDNAESHLLYSNDCVNSKGIAENAECGRFCLNLGGDAQL